VTLRIAMLTHSVLPRGGVVHALELAEALQARGHAVTLFAPAEPGQQLFRTPRVPLRLLSMPAVSGSLVDQVGQRIEVLTRELRGALAGFDLVHAQDSLNGNALAALAETGALPVPWVRTVHHLDDFEAPALLRWQRRAWSAAAAVGCVSDLWRDHFRHVLGVPAERLFNGVDLDRFTPHGPRAADAPYVLALGGVEARKNTPRLLQAFALTRTQGGLPAGLRLVIAGGASLLDHRAAAAKWREALAQHGLGEGAGQPVERRGPVADDAVPALLRGAALVAMPSLAEGFGLVALEALACGTPVLVSDRAPFTEHLTGEPYVAWCDPESVPSIATGLRAGLALPRPADPPAVCRAHSWARSAAVHEAWYARVLQAQPVAID
jgi:glycosyltransferase-like protein